MREGEDLFEAKGKEIVRWRMRREYTRSNPERDNYEREGETPAQRSPSHPITTPHTSHSPLAYSKCHTSALALVRIKLILLIKNCQQPSPLASLHASVASIVLSSTIPPTEMTKGWNGTVGRGRYFESFDR
jgi:hypothetical protein